jgi:hypothetical protein
MKKMLLAIVLVLLFAVPCLAFEPTDGAYMKVHADQDQMGGTISATIPFYVDYFRLGHSVKVSGLEGVAMIGATGGMQDQDMFAKAKATGEGGYYYYYGYNSVSWNQQQNQSGDYHNSFSGNGMYMKQCGSFNQNQYQNMSVSAPSSGYWQD